MKKKNKEFYEKYAGKIAECDGKRGIICGYDRYDVSLLMAVTEGKGWSVSTFIEEEEVITHKDNPLGYYFVDESHIIK